MMRVIEAIRLCVPSGLLRWWDDRGFFEYLKKDMAKGHPWFQWWRDEDCKLEVSAGRFHLIWK